MHLLTLLVDVDNVPRPLGAPAWVMFTMVPPLLNRSTRRMLMEAEMVKGGMSRSLMVQGMA